MVSRLKEEIIRDKEYLQSAKDRRCVACGNPNAVMHHLRTLGGGISLKPADNCCIPLCVNCHSTIHRDEQLFIDRYSFIWGSCIKTYANNLYENWLKNKK